MNRAAALLAAGSVGTSGRSNPLPAGTQGGAFGALPPDASGAGRPLRRLPPFGPLGPRHSSSANEDGEDDENDVDVLMAKLKAAGMPAEVLQVRGGRGSQGQCIVRQTASRRLLTAPFADSSLSGHAMACKNQLPVAYQHNGIMPHL